MSVSRRKDGRWCTKYKDAAGRWRQRSFRDEEEARRFDAGMAYDTQESARPTVFDAVVFYLRNHPGLCRKTKEQYARLVRPAGGGMKEGHAAFLADKYVDELSRRDLENLRGAMRSAGLSAAYANGVAGCLNAAFTFAAQEDIIVRNPWQKYRGLPARHRSRQAPVADVLAVYRLLPAWCQWACRTALALCLRPGASELFALEWSAFDWQARRVDVYMPKVRRAKAVFPPAWYWEEAVARHAEDAAAGQVLVCRGRKGRPAAYSTFYSAWRVARRKAHVTAAPYALRHLAASFMVEAGQGLASVAAQLGHASAMTTALFYAHPMEEAQRRAGACIPPLVRVGAGKQGKHPDIKRQTPGIGPSR